MTQTGDPRPGQSTWTADLLRYGPLLLVLLGAIVGYAFGLHSYLSLQSLSVHRAELKILASTYPVAALASFFLVYLLAVTFSFPVASVLTIFAGFLFGWVVGGITVSIAATAGATILFLAARNACFSLIDRKAGPFVERFAAGFRANAFYYLLVLRLAPVCPFFVVNIAPAFFKVSLRTYVIATFIGILPATFVFACLGAGLDSAIATAENSGRVLAFSDFMTPRIVLAFIALAAIAAVPAVIRHLRGQNGLRVEGKG